MNKTFLIAIIFAVLFLFGFAQDTKLYAQQKPLKQNSNKTGCAELPLHIFNDTDLNIYLCSYYNQNNPPTPEMGRKIRDEIVSYSKKLIDGSYEEYADKIYKSGKRETISKSVLDYVIDNNTNAKPKSLADGDCALKDRATCFRSSITSEKPNRKPSKELDVEILLLAMEIAHTQIAAEIDEKLKLDNKQYPLDIARRDLRRYYFAGTPFGAARELGVMLEKIKK